MLKKLKNAAILTLLTLGLLEVALQVGAVVVAWTHAGSPPVVDTGGRAVLLCVGDSFTYGLGATSHESTSYPAQLQGQLDAVEPGKWRVVNAGYPGRSSRGVLERIDAQLAELRPAQVAILVGLNDIWSQPERLDLTATPGAARGAGDGFRLEWRTRRFFLWLVDRLVGARAEDGAGLGLAGVEPFRPTLSADDPWRRKDAGGDAPALQELADAELERRALELPPTPPGSELPLLRAAARRLAGVAPGAALSAAVRAFLLTGDVGRFAGELRGGGDRFTPELLEATLRPLELSRGARETVAQRFADALGWTQADGLWIDPATGRQAALVTPRWLGAGPELQKVFETHRFHLEQIVARCRAAGAAPFLVGYPNRVSVPDVVFAQIADATGIAFVPTVAAFEERLGARDKSALFVPDGHCNDAGYAVLAELVRRHVIGR